MISIEHGSNVIEYIFHLMRADTTRNAEFISSIYKQEGLDVVANMSYLVSGWNRIPMPVGLLSDI